MKNIDRIIQGMMSTDRPSDYFATTYIDFVELAASKFTIQRNNQSVWEHTMAVIDIMSDKNPITLLSGLFHDLGKRYVKPSDDPSSSRFPGHDCLSATIAGQTLAEWGASSYLRDRVGRLVSTHMFDISCTMSTKTIRGFVADVGYDNVHNWFVLRVADSLSYDAQRQYYNHFIEPFRETVFAYLSQQPQLGQPKLEHIDGPGAVQIEGGDV